MKDVLKRLKIDLDSLKFGEIFLGGKGNFMAGTASRPSLQRRQTAETGLSPHFRNIYTLNYKNSCTVETDARPSLYTFKHFCRDFFTILAVLFIFLQFSVNLKAQKIAEKTNLAGWATLSPNIGTEVALAQQWTLEARLSYHPWKILETVSLRHWMASPEIRYWLCRNFEGSFVGFHAVTGQFNVRALPLTGMSRYYEYAGFFAGGGFNYGYQLPLSARWGLEFTAGLGYVWIAYDKFECKECREKVAQGFYNYFGPTRFGISLMYFLQ
jgi:hypothetical protein